jgi:hypothetical protein
MKSLIAATSFGLVLLTGGAVWAQQNAKVVAVDPAGRLAGTTVLGEWNAAGNFEGWAGSDLSGLGVSGGVLTATNATTSVNGSMSRTAMVGGADLDLGFNDYLQLRVKLPVGYAGDVRVEFGTATHPGFAATRQFVIPAASVVKDGAFHVYRLDLGLEVYWRGTLRDLRITPLIGFAGQFQVDYVEVGDVAGSAPALDLNTNFEAPLTAATTSRLASKHFCVWWDPADAAFTLVHARRALRMCEESFQVFCRKLGYNEPFREFDSTTTPRYKVNLITWYDGFWMGGYANRPHMNVGAGGLGDEGWGNPVPHELAHVVQSAQPGRLAGGHWESHANYLRAQRNLHFYEVIPGALPALDNLTANSNYRPDHNRHIYADQRYYLGLDDYGTQFGLPENFAATAWRDGARDKTIIEKLAAVVPVGGSVKNVACETLKFWPMLDFKEKTRLRAQHWSNLTNRNKFFWLQGAQLIPQQDKPGWWRVPLERAPDAWAYQVHRLTAAAGATLTVDVRGIDLPGSGEDWRWCLAAISAGDAVRYSPVWAPGSRSFTLAAGESEVFLIVTATPASHALDLDSLSNTKPVDKHPDRLRYAYEVRLTGAEPKPNQLAVANPTGFRVHPNGGGILGPSATASATAWIGPHAKVLGTARILESARVEDYAVVQGSATVQGKAVVSGFAVVEGNARIEASARVRDRAQVGNGAVVRGRALVAGYSRVENIIAQDDAIIRGCAYPLEGTISGTAIMDHDYSMGSSVSDGVHFSHVPWGGWWDVYYPQTLRKPRGLIASYRTEESDGAQWWDEFGALHGILRGSPVRSSDAAFNSNVLTFDGVDDYAALDRSVADTGNFSFSCWIKPGTPVGAVEPIMFLGSSATRALALRRNAAGRAVLTINDGATTRTLTGTSILAQNQWQHLAVTLNGTTASIFVGGLSEGSTACALTPLQVLAANNHTAPQANFLGRDWGGLLFKGAFEDVRFFNVARTSAEIREELSRRGSLLGQLSPSAPSDFNGTSTLGQTGVRNGRIRTLSAWVNPRTSPDVANYQAIIDSRDERGGSHGSGIGLDNGKWVARLDGVGYWTPAGTGNVVKLNQWQHVALAFNGTNAWFFIDGVQVATRTYSGPASDAAAAGKCYRLGFSQSGESTSTRVFFNGQILNARIHDKALGAAQIVLDSDADSVNDDLELYFATDPIDPLSVAPPLALWKFNQFGSNSGNPLIAGDLADPDADGTVNLLEYAFAGNPSVSSQTSGRPATTLTAGRLTLSFNRVVAQSDITLTVQGNDGLDGPWTELARSTDGGPMTPLLPGVGVSESGTGATRSVTVTDLYSISQRPIRMLRVDVRGE